MAKLLVMPLGEPTVATKHQPETDRQIPKESIMTKRCTAGMPVGSPTVYGGCTAGVQSVYHGGVQQVCTAGLYGRWYTVQQVCKQVGVPRVVRQVCTAGSSNGVRQCTVGGVQQVYGRWCTAVYNVGARSG